MAVILLVSATAFADIEWDGAYEGDADGGPSWTSATAHADRSNSSDSCSGEGWECLYTTEGKYCTWGYTVYAYADVWLSLHSGESCGAMAGGSASAYCSRGYGHSKSAYVSLSDSGTNGRYVSDWDAEDPPGVSLNGEGWFDPFEGVSASQYGFAAAGVYPGGGDTAHAHGCIQASVSLN